MRLSWSRPTARRITATLAAGGLAAVALFDSPAGAAGAWKGEETIRMFVKNPGGLGLLPAVTMNVYNPSWAWGSSANWQIDDVYVDPFRST